MRACGGQGVFRPERNGARPRAGPCAGTVPAAPARNGTAETEERYAAARAESQKKQPALHDILAGGPPGMPFFATARACRTRGGERRERRAVAKKAGCACRALRDRARGGCRSLFGENAEPGAASLRESRGEGEGVRRMPGNRADERRAKAQRHGRALQATRLPPRGGGLMRWGEGGFPFLPGLFPPACGGGGGIHRGREASRK